MEEIREIPEGWEHISLNNVGQIITGNTPDTNEDRYYDGKYMFIGPMDINENTLYIRESEKTITEIGLEQTRKIPANSICTVCIGSTIGKIGITSNICATNQQINTLITNKENDYKLIFYAMKYYLQDQLRVEAGLQAVPIVNKNRFSQLKLLVPKSKQEQQKISKILSTLDQNIEKTKQTIEKYINIKNGLMDDLLTGKRRIKDGKWVEETEFKEVEGVGRVPKDWTVEILDNLTSERIKDGTHSTPIYIDRGIPFLRVTDIHNKILNLDAMKYISEIEHKELVKRVNPEYGDILYSKNGTVGIARMIDWNWEFSIFVSLALIKPDHSKIDNKFLEIILNSFIAQNQIQLRIKQGTVINLHLEEIREFLIPVPNKKEQENIVAVLSKQDHLIEKEQQYLQKLKSLKSGLMEDLLTGKVRVNLSN